MKLFVEQDWPMLVNVWLYAVYFLLSNFLSITKVVQYLYCRKSMNAEVISILKGIFILFSTLKSR
jgi:hypothetical protein